MIGMTMRSGLIGALLAASCLGAGAQEGPPAVMGPGADITAMCGEKPMSIALIDGIANNTWRRITRAEMEAEARKCPNIQRVAYSDANGDPQKYNSDINSFVAQGFDIIIAFTDFGEASIPAFRAATQAGVTVVPYFSQLNGHVGKDYAANPYQDQVYVGGIWADWFGKNLKKGNVVFLGGTPGATSSQRFMDGFKKGLEKYPELKLLEDNYVATNWNPADGQRAVAGLIAKYGQIDGIASDAGVVTFGAVKAFQQAGLPVPAQATIASSNELNCAYLSDQQTDKKWNYLVVDGTTTLVRFAVRRAVADFQGTENKEPRAIIPFVNADTFADVKPKCDPSAPPDTDFSTALPLDQLYALIR